MNSSVIYIAFEQHQVAVKSNASEILGGLQQWFQAMLVSRPTQVIEQFEVRRYSEQYDVFKNGSLIRSGSTFPQGEPRVFTHWSKTKA